MSVPTEDLGGLSTHPEKPLRSESPSATEGDLGWAPCSVPECIEGMIRVPHKTYAGERASAGTHYVQMLEVKCYECRGEGLVSSSVSGTPSPDTTQEDR